MVAERELYSGRRRCNGCTPTPCCDQWDWNRPARAMQETDHAHGSFVLPVQWTHQAGCEVMDACGANMVETGAECRC